MLVLDRVSISYPSLNGESTAVLDSISCDIQRSSCVTIVGASGSGKTTLLRILSGLDSHYSGVVRMEGMAPVEARRRGKVGLIFQQPVLFPWRTVRENIELPGEIRSESYLKEGVQEMLRITQLEGYESYYPHQLSGGMQSRVAIARALVTQPDLLLLDEPFADLDEINRERMNLELQRIWMRSKATMVFVTHDLGEAAFLGDRVLVLSPRPARLVADIAVPFPRPRGPELLDSREFDEILAEIRRALRQPMSMASVEAEPAGQ